MRQERCWRWQNHDALSTYAYLVTPSSDERYQNCCVYEMMMMSQQGLSHESVLKSDMQGTLHRVKKEKNTTTAACKANRKRKVNKNKKQWLKYNFVFLIISFWTCRQKVAWLIKSYFNVRCIWMIVIRN